MLISEVCLLTHDLAATTTFYTEVLQLSVREQSGTAVCFAVGDTLLTFHHSSAPEAPFYHLAFSIPHNLAAEAQAWMAERVPILPGPAGEAILNFPAWQARAFYFHDNNGNILECIARQPLSNALPELCAPFLLSINEVGLPAHNVWQEAAALHASYNVPYFSRGPELPDFTVLGDDHGLFIVPAAGRGWLPTGRPAERHWLRVQFEQQGRQHTLELR